MRKTTKLYQEWRDNRWVEVECPTPSQPGDPGVWAHLRDGRSGLIRHITHFENEREPGRTPYIYIEEPKFQNGNWVWASKSLVWPSCIDRVEMVY